MTEDRIFKGKRKKSGNIVVGRLTMEFWLISFDLILEILLWLRVTRLELELLGWPIIYQTIFSTTLNSRKSFFSIDGILLGLCLRF